MYYGYLRISKGHIIIVTKPCETEQEAKIEFQEYYNGREDALNWTAEQGTIKIDGAPILINERANGKIIAG
jgi:riboflavin synthase alpha subunit